MRRLTIDLIPVCIKHVCFVNGYVSHRVCNFKVKKMLSGNMVGTFLHAWLVTSVGVLAYGAQDVCNCSQYDSVMDCSYRNCLQLPEDPPNDVTVLKMSGNGITEIGETYFDNYVPKDIKKVYLDNNNISTIMKFAFRSMHEITTVDLSNNNISYFELGSGYLPRLSNFSLAGNPLKEANFHSSLDFLNLSSCQLVSGNKVMTSLNTLKGLTDLDLSSNNLTDWGEILKYQSSMTRLGSLYVSGNQWTCDCSLDASEMEKVKKLVQEDNLTCTSPVDGSKFSLWDFSCPLPTKPTTIDSSTTSADLNTFDVTANRTENTFDVIANKTENTATTISDVISAASTVTSKTSDIIALACLCAASLLLLVVVVVFDYVRPADSDQLMATLVNVRQFPRAGVRWDALCRSPGGCELLRLHPNT